MSYKRPESVLVIVHTACGRVLLLQRHDKPSFWQSITGSLEAGETPPEAARREIAEETGLSGSLLDTLVDHRRSHRFKIIEPWRARYAPDVKENTEHVFSLELLAEPTIRLDPAEHDSYCWLPAEEAIERASSYTNRDAIATIVLPRARHRAVVILVHGLWMHGFLMRTLARHIRRAGYRTRELSYDFLHNAPVQNAAALAGMIRTLDAPVVHLVGHSLGGIVILHLLERYQDLPPGRVVMLGVPVQGSALARQVYAHRWLRPLLGRSVERGLLGGAPAGNLGRSIGVITGSKRFGIGALWRRADAVPDDGAVAESETRLGGGEIRISIPHTHSSMLFSRRCADLIVRFLDTGRFLPEKSRGLHGWTQ